MIVESEHVPFHRLATWWILVGIPRLHDIIWSISLIQTTWSLTKKCIELSRTNMYQKYIEIVAQEVYIYIYTQYIHNGIRQIVEGQVNSSKWCPEAWCFGLYGSKMKKELISGSENVGSQFFLGLKIEVDIRLTLYPLVNKHRPWKSPMFNGN